MDTASKLRTIPIHSQILKWNEPQVKQIIRRTVGDYPSLSPAILALAKKYSSRSLLGPPLCDQLIALLRHMFTDEEASVARYLSGVTGKTASAVVKAAHRSPEEVESVLVRLAHEKFVILRYTIKQQNLYRLIPILPGVFELSLMRTSLDTLTQWHKTFTELFEELFDTGYIREHIQGGSSIIRYLPVEQSVAGHSRALPADRFAEIVDKYTAFAVGLCQCRIAQNIVQRGCERPLENCIAFGTIAEYLIGRGKMRSISKESAIAVKREAESLGMATFIGELKYRELDGGGSCSCCGCCCHGLRTYNTFNAPGLIAPARFLPSVTASLCVWCGKCGAVCPGYAIVVDKKSKAYHYTIHRCIGCGLCAVACQKQKAITMVPRQKYTYPSKNIYINLLRDTPAMVKYGLKRLLKKK